MQLLSRRSFIKLAAATTTAVALPQALEMDFKVFAENAKDGEITRVPSLCNGCSSYCGVWASVKNGRLWKVEGNKTHIKSRGHLCARAHGIAQNVYNPGRVTQPMKRVDDKNNFQPITWEEAFQEVGTKMKDIVEEHGGDKFVWACHGGKETYAQQFMDIIGSANYITHYATCFTAKTNIWQNMVGGMYNSDFDQAKYMLFVGRNYAGGIIPAAMSRITEAKTKGSKIVVVDPRFCELATIADEWIPIRPGTDLAFYLGIAHTLISEELYDKKFVQEYVFGFDEFWMHNKDFDAEKAAGICGIPADKIWEIAHGLADNAPQAFLDPGYHGLAAHYQNSNETAMLNIIINALLGNYWKAGGLFPAASTTFGHPEATYYGPSAVKGPRADGAGVAGQYPLVEASRGIPQRIPDMIEKGTAKIVFFYSYNPLRSAPEPEYQKGIKNADLVVSIPLDWNETSLYTADYILPENHYLERTEHPKVINGNVYWPAAQVATRFKALESTTSSLGLLDIMQGLTKAYGIENLYGYTVEEELEVALGPLGITVEQLREKGCIELMPSVLPKDEGIHFNTFTGKIEFSIGAWRKEGYQGVPTWVPPLVKPQAANEFRLIHGKQPWHSHIMTTNNPYLMSITEEKKGTYMWMNRSRAAELGLQEGDWATVKSDITSKQVQIHATEGLHPDCVWVPSTYGTYSEKLEIGYGKGVNYNDFIPARVDKKTGHVMGQECIVTIAKGGK
ncbi:anaerobic dehydrogenase, typically selenocysteine-containing [Desulfitobacterium dichloroeliminans LMG P-21439]|uniref:Anaerobic dehydrogenase, typically selenocysteine-containing n=1 Tax=Desulfitobacterium dichloroeliminans (strain LMG P-21439 / DCA1) TaxID=871963 RepID=L0F4K0_DESDL|nr:respiratory selenite reductase catalytic subunit SrrA [Desulfitobacterium dichloroeliminans]AGA68764.1 anaerobic dehydrogenase, typically selenocysteine-containing [Desulfitobacterium dichloroeliminans LMG P-21439]